MAQNPSEEQIAFKDTFATGEPEDIADFLQLNKKRMQKFMQLTPRDYSRLIDYLKSGNPDMIDRALTRFDESMELVHGFPTRGITLTPLVKKPVVRAQLKNEFESLVKSAKKLAPISTLADTWALMMAMVGFDRNGRNKIASTGMGTLIGSVAGLALNSMLAVNSAQAALPPVEESIEPSRTPMEITVRPQRAFNEQQAEHIYINPYLFAKLQKDATARQIFQWSIEEANANGLHPLRFAHQMFRESVHYNPAVIDCTKLSPKAAMGTSQIIKAKGDEYGMTRDDYCNPQTSIAFGARIMRDLMKKFNNDQGLAEAAYNGGNKAVAFAAEELSLKVAELNADIWLSFNNDRHAEKANAATHPFAWHNETRAYVADLDGSGWDAKMVAWAKRQQGNGFNLKDFRTSDSFSVSQIGILPQRVAKPAPQPSG